MEASTTIKTGLRILAACFVFAVCLGIGGALAGVAELVPKEAQAQGTPGFFLAFATFCLTVGSVLSYFVLRSSWGGLRLVTVLFAATYGISTIATQVESVFFLSAMMPSGMIAALFLQGAIAMALFAPLAVLILGKWRRTNLPAGNLNVQPMMAAAITWRIAFLVVAFIFLYMLFGYYIAWRNPALRAYYGGADVAGFYEALKSNWQKQPLLFLLQVFRSLLYVACVYPLLSRLPVTRWEKVVATAIFLASWSTALLLPNALMPAIVARTHLWETLAFNLTFGALMGWLLGSSGTSVGRAQEVN